MSNGVSISAAEFKVICKGTYWIVKQKVYLFGFIPFWQRFCWGANELKRYATKAMALIGIAEYIAARDREGKTCYYTADEIRNSVYVPQPPDGDR